MNNTIKIHVTSWWFVLDSDEFYIAFQTAFGVVYIGYAFFCYMAKIRSKIVQQPGFDVEVPSNIYEEVELRWKLNHLLNS